MYLEFEIALYHVRDKTHNYALSMYLLRHDLYLYYQWLVDLRKCVMSAMCELHVLYLCS